LSDFDGLAKNAWHFLFALSFSASKVFNFSGLLDLLFFKFDLGERFKFGRCLFLETGCTGGKSLMVGVAELWSLF